MTGFFTSPFMPESNAFYKELTALSDFYNIYSLN